MIVLPTDNLYAQRSSDPIGGIQGSRRYPNPLLYEDIRPPSVELISPGECEIIDENDPLIIIGYRDPFSGVDLSTLVIRIDDFDSFTIDTNEASYQVPSSSNLTEGNTRSKSTCP